MTLSPRGQILIWIIAFAATLFLGVVEIAAAHQFRLAYLAATACIAVILGERVVRTYLKSRAGSQKESAQSRDN
jgi:hypothetical protein